MSIPLYTSRLSQLHDITGTAYSDPVEPGTLWVVRCMTFWTNSEGPARMDVGNGAVNVVTFNNSNLPSTTSYAWTGRWVLEPYERIVAAADVSDVLGAGIDFHASGWILQEA